MTYGIFGWDREQDFDAHGSDPSSHHTGGISAGFVTILDNSLADDGPNVDIRGTPCHPTHIDGNVFADDFDSAIRSESDDASMVLVIGDAFSAWSGTTETGDFDGDGVVDDFLATGAAWYYRPGRTKEWRFLSRARDVAAKLTFGDFDGDGRTDLRRVDPKIGITETSWGGSSPWDLPSLAVGVGGGGVLGPLR